MEPEPLIGVTLFLDPGDKVEIHGIARLKTMPQIIGGIATDIVVVLLDKDGTVIAGVIAQELPLEGPSPNAATKDCGCRKLLGALVSNRVRGAKLQIRCGGTVLWQRSAPETEVSVKDVQAEVDKKGALHLAWSLTVADGLEPRTDVLWLLKDSDGWRVLTVGLRPTSCSRCASSASPARASPPSATISPAIRVPTTMLACPGCGTLILGDRVRSAVPGTVYLFPYSSSNRSRVGWSRW